MAKYINREDLNFLNDFRIDSGKYAGLRLDDVFDELATADVIERAEYEKLLEENKQLKRIISDKVNEDLKCAFEVKELRSKIDKAKKQITDSMNEHLASDGTPIDEYAYCYLNALEILEENIGE